MPGHVGIDEAQRTFFVSDHGKQKIFSYNLDSVLANPFYIPNIKADIKIGLFPDTYRYINDTLCIGRIIEPIGTNDFKSLVAKWNMQTGEIRPMKYEHPDIKKKRITADVSPEYGLYVECYSRYDLMTICDLNGNLKYNIYGPKWEKETTQTAHYSQPVFCGNKIIAGYSGGDHRTVPITQPSYSSSTSTATISKHWKLNIKYPVFAMIGKITGSFCAWMMRYNSVIWIWMGLLNSQKNYTSYLPSPNPSIIIDEMDIFTQSIHYD